MSEVFEAVSRAMGWTETEIAAHAKLVKAIPKDIDTLTTALFGTELLSLRDADYWARRIAGDRVHNSSAEATQRAWVRQGPPRMANGELLRKLKAARS